MKNIKKTLLGIIACIAIITTANAEILPHYENIINFTPTRPGIPLYQADGTAHPGFPYVTFNNFTGALQTAGPAREYPPENTSGDERAFLIGKHCADQNSNGFGNDDEERCVNTAYTNTINPVGAKEGDRVRFSVYFHNNGADNYDDDTTSNSPDATNVNIGISLNNIQDPTYDFIIHPLSFINADNNQYKDSNGNTILRGGSPVREATDDMQIIWPEYGYNLQLLEDSASLIIKKDLEQTIPTVLNITREQDIEFETKDGKSITVKVKPYYDATNQKLWLHFNRLPGCFRYSGKVTFDAIVKKEVQPTICTDLTWDNPSPSTVNGQLAYKFDGEYATFTNPDGIPQSYIDAPLVHVSTTDPNGKFYLKAPNLPPVLDIGVEIPKSSDNSITIALQQEFYYVGTGRITMTLETSAHPSGLSDLLPEMANPAVCVKTFEIPITPPPVNYCKSLSVVQPTEQTAVTINGEKYYKLTVSNVEFEGPVPQTAKLGWRSTQDPNGVFYKPTTLYGVPDGQGGETDVTSYVRIGTESAETTLNEKVVYFKGNGPVYVTVTGTGNDVNSLKFCLGVFNIPVTPPPVLECKEIVVTRPEEIVEGTVSTFTAHSESTNADGTDFTGDITYSVDEGYGYFTTTQPASVPVNPSPRGTYRGNNTSNVAPLPGFLLLDTDLRLIPDLLTTGVFTKNPTVFTNLRNLAIEKASSGRSAATAKTGGLNTTVLENYYKEVLPNNKVLGIKSENVITTTTRTPGTQTLFESITKDTAVPRAEKNVPSISRDLQTNVLGHDLLAFTVDDLDTVTETMEAVGEVDLTTAVEELREARANQTGTSITVAPGTTVYFVATRASDGQNVVHIVTEGTNVKNCRVDLPIVKEQVAICKTLDLISVEPPNAQSLDVGQTAIFRVSAFDTNGESLNTSAPETNLDWQTTAGGILTHRTSTGTVIGSNTSGLLNLLLSQQPVTFTGSTQSGQVSVGIDITDPLFSASCYYRIPVIAPPLICTDLNVEILEWGTENTVTQLEPNTTYTLTSSATFTAENPNAKIRYRVRGTGSVLRSTDNLPRREVIVNSGDQVILDVFNETSSLTDLLSVEVVGTKVPECSASFDLKVPDEVFRCVDLDIEEPDRPWEISDNDDDETFIIDVESSPAGREDELRIVWDVTGGGEWTRGDNDDHQELPGNVTSNILTNFDEDTEVTIYALGFEDDCEVTLSPRERNEKKPPRITKTVAVSDDNPDSSDYESTLNIRHDTSEVTYRIEFETYSDIEEARLRDSNLENGQIDGSLGGSLDFEGMRINIDDDNNTYGLLETNYDSDDDDDGYGMKSDSYLEGFICDSQGDNDFCLDLGSNFYDDENFDAEDIRDEVDSLFSDGNDLTFRNVPNNVRIIIKYQMSVDSKLTENTCKNRRAEEGCGEEFVNEAEFKTENDEEFSDSDSTKVIVICPFILLRAGGDAFFEDVEDIEGIDVSYCSPVKTSPGPGITPIEPRMITPSTGEPAPLSYSTHDICKMNNTEVFDKEKLEGGDPLESYKDVLQNFSSTICEMQAVVAKEWKEENINKQIRANITRIARWEENLKNLPSNTLSDMNKLTEMSNAESGVFVRTSGPLTIDLDSTLGAVGIVPAAQTYIVQGHDLIINSDIKYSEFTDYNPKSMPSAAFIVIDGNLIIDSEVKQLDGIFMVIDGQVKSNGVSKKTLTINGSLIGDVVDLFKNRTAVGDPTKDEASITIRYDEKFLLNTPPGLGELLDITQLRVAY